MTSRAKMQQIAPAPSRAPRNAAPAKYETTRFPVDWFDRRMGLPTSQIHDIDFSSDGRLWAATPAGLLSYDGVRLSQFGRDDGLMCHGLRSVAIDGQDRLWIASDAGLQCMSIEDNRLAPVHWDPHGIVDEIAVTKRGCALATPRGLHFSDEQGKQSRPVSPSLSEAPFASIQAHPSGSFVAASPTQGVIVLRPNGKPSRILTADAAEIGDLRIAIWGPDALLLVGGDKGLAVINESGEILGALICEESVSALCWDEGNIWAAVGSSVLQCRIDGAEIRVVGRVITGVQVNSMRKDHFGNVWIATDSAGIARLNCLRHIVSYPETPDLGGILCVRSATEDIILAGAGGLSLPGESVMLRGSKVWDVLEDRMGVHWAATDKGLYVLVNRSLPMPFHQDCLTLAAPCRALALFADGLLVGSIRGLVRTGSGGTVELSGPDGASLGYVYSIHVDASGVAWVATLGAGLWRYDGENLARISGGSLPESCNVYAIAEDAEGTLFVAHDNLISRIRPRSEPKSMWKTNDAIAAWALLWTKQGCLLAGTSRGLFVFDAVTGEPLRQLCDPSGTNNWEFTTSRSLAIGDGDSILCGLASGLARVSLSRLEAWETRPSAEIDSVRWAGIEPDDHAGLPVVQEGRWQVEFNVRTGWYLDEAACTMRHRLLGFDSNWSAFRPISAITYSSLPPGSYTLEVEVRSPISGIGRTCTLFTFEVRGKLTALALSLLDRLPRALGKNGLYDRVRRARLDRKKRELEQLIRMRTIELEAVNNQLASAHDKLDVLAHTDPLSEIANRRLFERALDLAFARAAATAGNLSLVMIDIDHFKSYNDRYGHALGDEALKRVAQALKAGLRKSEDLVARIGGEEFAVLLPDSGLNAAARVAERLNQAVRLLAIPHDGSTTADCVTISAGIAAFDARIEDKEALLTVADQELYRAKAGGRDRWSPRPRSR